MPKKLITPPTAEPLTLDEAKAHARIDGAADDTYVTGLIPACRELYEKISERSVMAQTWDVAFDDFPRYHRDRYNGRYADASEFSDYPERYLHHDLYLELPVPPVQSVTSITYIDSNGTPQTLDPALFQVDLITEPARVYAAYGQAWPGVRLQRNAVTVRIVTGYPDAASVPATMKLAIKALIAHFYENREPVAAVAGVRPEELPLHLHTLLAADSTGASWL